MEMIPDKTNKNVTPVALEKIFRLLQRMPGGAKVMVVAGALVLYLIPDFIPIVQDVIDLILAITGFLVVISPKKEQ